MRILIFIFGFLAAVSVCPAQEAEQVADTALKKKKNELHRRIDNGDFTAFSDAATMPAAAAIPFLWWYADQISIPAHTPALAALKQVHGYESYFATKLAEASAKGGVDEKSFQILSAIGTHEATAVVAPYLFDLTTIRTGEDTFSSTAAVSASLSLGRMKLDDAPIQKSADSYNADDIVEWQKWAVIQGLVPKGWNSRVGKGEVLRQLRTTEKAELSQPAPAPIPTTHLPASSQSSAPAAIPLPLPAVTHTTGPTLERKALVWPWVAGIFAVIVIVAVAVGRRA